MDSQDKSLSAAPGYATSDPTQSPEQLQRTGHFTKSLILLIFKYIKYFTEIHGTPPLPHSHSGYIVKPEPMVSHTLTPPPSGKERAMETQEKDVAGTVVQGARVWTSPSHLARSRQVTQS